MSSTTLYKVYNKHTEVLAEYGNSRETAPPLWDHLARTYLGWPDSWTHQNTPEDDRPLWRLARDPEVPRALRFCHAMTFDDALLPMHGIAEAIENCLEVGLRTIPGTHWSQFAGTLRRFVKQPNPGVIGVALNCTSVNDIWQGRKSFKKCYDLTRFIVQPL